MEFNDRWDAIINDLTEDSKKIENDLLDQHEAERRKLEEEIARQQVPPVKFSSQLLDNNFKLEQLIRNKKYQTAKLLKEKIDLMQEAELEEWERKFHAQREKQKELLLKKQKNEYEALKTRLEKSINSKLKMRMNDYDKLLQRIQNLQNELITKQTLQFSKIQSANAKILSKYDLNLNELSVTKNSNTFLDFSAKHDNPAFESTPANAPAGANFARNAQMKPIIEREEQDMLSDTRFNDKQSPKERNTRQEDRKSKGALQQRWDDEEGDGRWSRADKQWPRRGRRLTKGPREWPGRGTVTRGRHSGNSRAWGRGGSGRKEGSRRSEPSRGRERCTRWT